MSPEEKTTESTVEDLASMLIRQLPPPPAPGAATLARVAARLQMAIERRSDARPRHAILLIAAALGLVLAKMRRRAARVE